jgi:hypothetical protein
MTTETNADRAGPAYTAFVVSAKREGQEKATWREIGACWPHKDGNGFDIVLIATPVSGRIVLRKPKA